MKKFYFLLFVVSALLTAPAARAQQPDFSGIWILNLQKSKLEDMGTDFTGSRFIIEQKGDRLTLTRYHYFGPKKNKIRFRMTADGKTRRVKVLFRGKLEKQEGRLLATLWRKNFLNVVQYRFGSSPNEFIADEVFKGRPKDHHNIWVFDREGQPAQ
jgi:hypothetical protein